MPRWIAFLILPLVACSQAAGSPVGGVSPSPSAPVQSSPSDLPRATPTPTPDLPLATVDFPCRLPVIRSTGFGYVGGFLTFPAATFAPDPAGSLHNRPDGFIVTDTGPTLLGSSGAVLPTYDLAQRRWLPASAYQVTPDGAFYAYSVWDPASPSRDSVHVVDVAQATERVFEVAVPANALGFTVADFDAAGIYLVTNQFEQLPDGVSLLDPKTGATRSLHSVSHVIFVRRGYAWVAKIDPRDPSPPVLRRSGTPSDSVVRVDLASGAETTWFYRPGMEVWLEGFYLGNEPIVSVFDPNSTDQAATWLGNNPYGPELQLGPGLYLGAPQQDGDRIWFGGYSGIYLYVRDRGLIKVAAFTDLKSGESVLPAGSCR